MDLKAAVSDNERLSADVARAEGAVDALEQEHRRFVEHASELCDRKDADLVVSRSCVPLSGSSNDVLMQRCARL
jgi:hypothetical protein